MSQAATFQIKQLGTVPWILPNNIAVGQGLSLTITNVAGANTVLQGIGTGNFQLSWQGRDAQITTVTGFNLFDPVNRKPIRDALDSFLIALDQLEATQNLVPGGARLVAQVTAQYLPLPLVEIPLYAFNLTNPVLYPFLATTQTYVDLLPGMRLNVCYGNFYQENLGQQTVPAYGGGGSGYITVSTMAGTNQLSYESFMDPMDIRVPLNGSSKLRIAAGAADLMAAGETQPYNRLFYPTAPGSGFTPIDVPDNNPGKNATIVRAGSYQDMLVYTSSFPYCCQSAGGRCALFFGRTQLIPEISVRVNGEQLYVPVGTTLKHIVERNYSGIVRPKTLQFLRGINQNGVMINFENATIGYELCLVPGDDLSW